MARDRGVLLSDKVTPCSATLNGPSKTSTQAQWTLSSRYDAGGPTVVNQCVVYIFGVEINTASFAMYTFSVSVFIQAILIISMSGAADHGSHRKLLLVAFAVIGSVSTMLFLGVVPKIYMVGAVIAITPLLWMVLAPKKIILIRQTILIMALSLPSPRPCFMPIKEIAKTLKRTCILQLPLQFRKS
jgi:hypothetical protein